MRAVPRSRWRLSEWRKGDGSEVSGATDGEKGPLSSRSERVQKEGFGRCAADAGRKVRKRNEKECNKLAVRLFSTCIKTSSGATDDLESIARHFPRPSTGACPPSPRTTSPPLSGPTGPATRKVPILPGSSTALRARDMN